MNARHSLLSAAVLAFVSTLSARAATETIWHETFDQIGNDNTKWSSEGTSLEKVDVAGWTVVSGSVYTGQKGVRVGAAKTPAVFKSPAIVPVNRIDGIDVAVNCAAYYNVAGTQYIKIVVVDDSNNNLATFGGASESGSLDGTLTQHTSADAVEIPTTSGYMKSFTIPASAFPASGNIYLVFSCDTTNPSSQNRLLIGDVLVTQTISSSGPSPLAAPTGLEASAITDASFSLSWNAVAGADGYEVEVLAGSTAAGTVSVSGTGATVTDLAADTAYAAKVKALAPTDSTDYEDSDWSDPIDVPTALAGGLVRTTLFAENFTNITANTWASTDYHASRTGDTGEWTSAGSNVLANAKSAIILGRAKNGWSVLSPEIVLTNNLASGSVRVSFDAATYAKSSNGELTDLFLSVVDVEAATTNRVGTYSGLARLATNATAVADAGAGGVADPVSVPERFRLLFTTSGYGRAYLDTILVSQTFLPLPALATPAPVAANATASSVEAIWPAVAGATGYAVELRDAEGVRLAFDASLAATNRTFEGLAANTVHAIRVRALGDGSATGNSAWSDPVAAQTLPDANAPAFSAGEGAGDAVTARSAKTFSVTATRDGAPVAVSFAGLAPAASGTAPAWADGTFSWTPDDADAGANGTVFSARFTTDGGAYATNVVFTVLPRPALAAPTISADAVECKTASFSWDDQPRAASYAVRLWRGTADYRNPLCFEDFGEGGTMPDGWSGTGTEWYEKSGYESSRVKFATDGASLVSKLHSAAVTNLSFHVRSSSTTATSTWTLFASTGGTGDGDWVEISSATIGTGNRIFSFGAEKNYRRFKWVFTKGTGTMGLGDIAAAHEGASAIFALGTAEAAVSVGTDRTLEASGLRPGREYFLEVTVTGDDGTTTKSAVLRFTTNPAHRATVFIIK